MPDHELGDHFDGLAQDGVELLAVLDCCHSVGGDRVGASARVRQINRILPADPRSKQPEEITQVVESNGRAGNLKPSYWNRARKYALLAACHPNQLAGEWTNPDTRLRYGAFTATLLSGVEAYRRNGQRLNCSTLF